MMQDELTEARRCLERGDRPRAEAIYRQVLAASPENPTALHELGVVLLQTGRPSEAAGYLRQAVALDGANPSYQNHLGVALAGLHQDDEAMEHLGRAVELDPRLPDAHYNLAKVYQSAGRLDEAAAHYRESLKIAPRNHEAQFNLANALRDLRRGDEAAAAYREAVRLRPGYLKAHNNLGNLLRELGRLEEAIAQHRETVRLKPDYAEGHQNLGVSLAARKRFPEAEASFRKALELRPDFAAARNGLAKTMVEQGKLDEAIGLLKPIAELDESCVGAYLKLGEKLRTAGRVDEAVDYARKVLETKSDLAVAHHNLGLALLAKNEPEQAVDCYRRALAIKPDFAEVHNNLAVALHTLGRFEEGLRHIERTLDIRPNFAIAHLNRAVSLLRMGQFERGWQEFEWRRMCENHRVPRFAAPLWDGAPLPEGTILLTAEQGLGDTLHMIRYAPLVKQRCQTVVVQTQKTLLPLLQRCPGIDRLVTREDKRPEVQAQIPLMSLPRVLGTDLSNIPAEVPYVFADAPLTETWRQRLAEYEGFTVGIAWQGNKKYAGDPWRSLPLRHFLPLARIPGVRLFSLQKGEGTEQIAELPDDVRPVEFGADFDGRAGPFMDTAAVIQHMDLVITSDTAIPHLAGAMARPVWVALHFASDWRWLDQRSDSPWYPTMRLFRQKSLGDWEELFGGIAEELRAVVDGDRARLAPVRQTAPVSLQVPVSPGELLDKLTILEIKSQRMTNPAKLENVRRELQELCRVYAHSISPSTELVGLLAELKTVNERLWEIEDAIRVCDAQGDFGARFTELARSVYVTNDRRGAIKRQIDMLLGSTLIEEKQYAAHQEDLALPDGRSFREQT